MTVYNNLYTIRKQKNKTQKELSEEVGVTRRTIISLEKGNYVPSLYLALKISKVLKVDIKKIFWIKE
ncbi:helix-turn-helix transcriptional regulator [Staphylococcus epidermidis]|uniref:helix-turn-helix transcriptional regulator n=1 Tax=Staphylococcus TaxID=1279 RepID=UPI00094A2FE9|nr:helix-turn-helix transcriptional regulator [Staphylococcus epidermidis]APT17797.1 transcriptional regulator [Staphylococcus epidermidis]MDS3930002.1 helix-turn-helix transcriptional regulator [Staphylococcus epidermidis]